MGDHFDIYNLENYGFLISAEFVDRKTGFVKLFILPRAETDKLPREIFEAFEAYSLGSTEPFPDKLIESYTRYGIIYEPYFSTGSEKNRKLVIRSQTSNGDLTVSVIERIHKVSISEFIEIRNQPFYFGFSLH
jgi:hypothetical protein